MTHPVGPPLNGYYDRAPVVLQGDIGEDAACACTCLSQCEIPAHGRRYDRSTLQVHDARMHDERDALQLGYVGEGIAVNGDNVGSFARRNRADLGCQL